MEVEIPIVRYLGTSKSQDADFFGTYEVNHTRSDVRRGGERDSCSELSSGATESSKFLSRILEVEKESTTFSLECHDAEFEAG